MVLLVPAGLTHASEVSCGLLGDSAGLSYLFSCDWA